MNGVERRALHYVDAAAWAEEVLGFAPDPTQREVLRANDRYGILNCARQWGKSTVTAVKALHRAVHFPGSLVVVVCPSWRQSAEFVGKAAAFLGRLGLKRRGDGANRASLQFPNGSRIVGLPSNPDTIRGFSKVALVIVDEAARVKDEVYVSVQPMQGTCGADASLWLMSTPKGKRGFFWREWSAGSAAWRRIAVSGEDCPRIGREFLEGRRRDMSRARFREEYECGFQDSEDSVFREADVRASLRPEVGPLLRGDGR